MRGSVRLWIVGLLLLMAAPLAIDGMVARAQLDDIVIETWLDAPGVVADGRHTVVIYVRVTENGRPREGDLLQCWLQTGSGLLISPWIITDERGEGHTNFTPNPYSPYDPKDAAQIIVKDTSIGRLIEVSKEHSVRVPLIKPDKK